ncbi:sterol desaturase/sphingolipid hydroxylase (fatty acid hydroxylase superfamily) [Devosia subaequoris]|uniref:Sterol desaturase/sphingolipid hydroxylase (Fatty acid hydroxylase superfamily) n=1 Tax=Devosia subaequoris TaxID=395930 RepID=A0A7W6IKQ5_9HYPH|nr:sterol desaturase family protein [Devosia subaequoris]MBB4051350.1 sterol desaturase/sphingolipid hydroxylase (fatty acid hydroxylase superfamily) [Devosia subaequoris]
MIDILFLPEPIIRFGSFVLIFGLLAVIELTHPRLERPEMLAALKTRRWLTNVGILVISSVSLRVLFPAAAVGTALWAESQGFGIFNQFDVPLWLAALISIIVLDFAVWLEHLLSHKIPILWRIHRMHHADTGFDLTTALRFHPLEIVLSMVWKAAIVVALGAPAWSVLIFEVVLNGAAMFNHANVNLPARIDRFVRLLVVTPDMHRVHHSTDRREADSNYGFNLAIWDRIFATYTDQPAKGHRHMDIGLADYRDTAPTRLGWSLLLPFRRR